MADQDKKVICRHSETISRRQQYCDNCRCENCELNRQRKANKEDKPHGLACCCTFMLAIILAFVYGDTSSAMAYDAECMLYAIETADCCYDKSCHYGSQQIFHFAANCAECERFYGISNGTIARNVSVANLPDVVTRYSLLFERRTQCYPSQIALTEAHNSSADILFNFERETPMKCHVARYTKQRKKLSDSVVVECSTWWFAQEFESVNWWLPVVIVCTLLSFVVALVLYAWDVANRYYDITIVRKTTPAESTDEGDATDKDTDELKKEK